MRSVTYSMAVSLDGYIVGPDGSFDWTVPDEEVFRLATDEAREVGVHLMGRTAVRDHAVLQTYELLPASAAVAARPGLRLAENVSSVPGSGRDAGIASRPRPQ